jgi:ABC-2 type transport system permease protein
MIWRIARKEFTEIVRDGRFRLLSVLVLTIATVSLAAGWKHYVDVRQQHEEAQRGTREQWLNQPAKNPHSAAHYGVYAFKPTTRLSLIDTGVEPFVGVAAWLEAHRQNEFKYRPAQDRTALQRFGELTAAEGLLVLAPLFIVLVAFPAFSGEREQGTLRQLLALGVKPSRLAAGKSIGLSAALALVLLPATALGLLALSLTASGGTTWKEALAGDAPRATLLAAAYLTYFALFLALSIGVSARASSSRVALVILLSFWFANSFLASRATADLANVLYPTPSAAAFQRGLDEDLNDRTALDRRLDARRQELMKQYNVTTMTAVPVNFAGISLQEGENHGNEVFDRHFDRLFTRYEQQNAAMQLSGVAAPALPMRALSMALSGTDFAHHRDFVNAAEAYRRSIQRTLNADIVSHTAQGYTAGHELWERVPAFAYDEPGAGWALGRTMTSVWLLGAWLALGVVFAVRGVARVRVA